VTAVGVSVIGSSTSATSAASVMPSNRATRQKELIDVRDRHKR
jgi:hypothetical protein